jgi:DNA-binding response OmpR family regulator
MSRIVFVSDDLLFWSRVQSLARAAGTEAVRIGDEAGMERAFLEGGVTRVIADLGAKGVDLAAWAERWRGATPRPELVAFGSHVDETALSSARAAGFDRVMPNSRFHREVGDLVR